MTQGASERTYARAIEGAWTRLTGRPVVLSPREFELVAGWCRDGIPLRVVLEVLDHEGRRSGGRREPRSLRFLAAAVREAGAAVASGRSSPLAASPSSSSAPRDLWAEALAAAPALSSLHALLDRLLAAAAEGMPASQLDDLLDDELARCAPPDLLLDATEQARKALAPFRNRMALEERDRALQRGVADRLRRALSLPRAALSAPAKIE